MAAAVATGIAAVPASAQRKPQLFTLWTIQPGPFDPSEHDVSDGETVLRQRLVPSALAVLGSDVTSNDWGRLTAKAGTQLVEARYPQGAVFCALDTLRFDKKANADVPNTRGSTLCLLDADRNGRFEAVFAMPAGIGLPMVRGPVPKTTETVDAAYEIRPVDEVRGDFFVGIRYEQYFNIYGNRMLMVDFGGRGQKTTLTDFLTFKAKGSYPVTKEVLGASITVLAAQEKGVRLRIDRPMPPQPFAVFSSTTTQFIPIYR